MQCPIAALRASTASLGSVVSAAQLVHRLYEDPTRISGVRPYEAGDPLNRVHWRATARTGALHSKRISMLATLSCSKEWLTSLYRLSERPCCSV